ncbi:chemotaxis protein CheA [Mobilitalea sibirica]|uniref:Chemotaxis protein CheA n=1 Tax=Mobilitalea sibirica TaxID=1462919 RepID=A0A8J7KWZ0_9FIRM|nr:chemotaxis protein CheA [Mobilitalea sibirica]MBH1941112.1 chemotaxis protein CheA [Mobilitalea sibirica]
MSELYANEPMMDMYIFETTQNIEQLETCILDTEKAGYYSQNVVNEIFRIMHTIKGSSAMMLFNNISMLAHTVEDLFYFLREHKPEQIDYSTLSDLVLEVVDFIKGELDKITQGDKVNRDSTILSSKIKDYLEELKQQNAITELIEKPVIEKQSHYYIAQDKTENKINLHMYKAIIFFDDGCEMENIRAYTITHHLRDMADEIYYLPQDIIENDESIHLIREEGFQLYVKINKTYNEMFEFLKQTIFLKDLELIELDNDEEFKQFYKPIKKIILDTPPVMIPKINNQNYQEGKEQTITSSNQSIISVNVAKLDKLMDLVGEMVIAEAMVTQNPDLKGLTIVNFHKAARQLHKITTELQDMVMAIRMVPLSTTFHKMHRIVRDMSKKLGKEVKLELIGEETEVDKNIIEHISDPLMHLVRNAIDHGLEATKDRVTLEKPKIGKVTLEARNAGSDVLILVKDDGKGLNKQKILDRARENDLLIKTENEMTDKEIYNLILLPGFSTKEAVSEYSGRGVGMDVVTNNIEAVGGSVSIDSEEGIGTTITLKIPLTLAIIDGMNISVGKSRYTIPTTTIKESFRPKENDLIKDPDGNEMIMVRGQCFPILRLHELYKVKTEVTDFTQGILIMVEQDEKTLCIFADMLLGQQQVVVKTLPSYIKSTRKIQGLAGCTLLGDGNISLILDIGGLVNLNG